MNAPPLNVRARGVGGGRWGIMQRAQMIFLGLAQW